MANQYHMDHEDQTSLLGVPGVTVFSGCTHLHMLFTSDMPLESKGGHGIMDGCTHMHTIYPLVSDTFRHTTVMGHSTPTLDGLHEDLLYYKIRP